MEYIFAAAVAGFALLHLYLYLGLSKSIGLDDSTSHFLPSVSVIVAGRNEEKNILTCIQSLAKLKYPADKLEIILVNDRSDDRTLKIMQDAASGLPQFKVINSRDSTHSNLRGKANAIDTAIEMSSGEIIMTTDADCTVNENWIFNTVKYYHQDVAMVCGFTLITYEKSLFDKLQCLDWLYLLALASSSCGLGKIMSCIGNNLSFRKSVYREAGGYSAIDFSVTEDLALMRRIGKSSNSRIVYPVNADALVMTQPCESVSELTSQKRRWFRGGIGINFLGYFTGIGLYTSSIVLLFGSFFVELKLWLSLCLVILLSMLFLSSRCLTRMQVVSLAGYFPLFNIYLAVYGLLLPFSFVFGKSINWKGRKF